MKGDLKGFLELFFKCIKILKGGFLVSLFFFDCPQMYCMQDHVEIHALALVQVSNVFTDRDVRV